MLALRRAPLRNRRIASMSAIWHETAVQQCPLPAHFSRADGLPSCPPL